MTLYSQNENYKLYQGNMLDMLEAISPESIDSIVTDPPYGLTSIVDRFGKEGSAPAKHGKDGSFARLSRGFMGKEWDGSGIEYNVDAWRKCYKVLKSGGYLLAFGGSRTFHRIACAIEDAGFEIRDTIMWLYGSGFPKSMNIGLALDKKNGIDNRTGNIKTDGGVGGGVRCFSDDNYVWKREYEERKAQNEWSGWGTALKPAYEPVIVARKPFKGSCVDNVVKYGVGGINIDECRIELEEGYVFKETNRHSRQNNVFTADSCGFESENNHTASASPDGRFPANVILTYDETDFDEVCGGFPVGGKNGTISKDYSNNALIYGKYNKTPAFEAYNDSGSASRYFYCAKASKKDRDEGLDGFEEKTTHELQGRKPNSLGSIMADDANHKGRNNPANPYAGAGMPKRNTHPTVKPTSLMQYLIRLVTPNGGTVLDPFNGSGSTGKAVMYENAERNKGYKYIGIELTEEYLPIAKARIENISVQPKVVEPTLFEGVV